MTSDLRRCGLLIALTSSACSDECSLDSYIGDFAEHHDAIDCHFAHRFIGDDHYEGALPVRECILEALGHRAFIGGYIGQGIDSRSTYAYLGTADGEIELVIENVDAIRDSRSLSRASCHLIVMQDDIDVLGLQCAAPLHLEPVCRE